MTTSLHLWLRLLTSCLGLWGFGWAASIAWKRKRDLGQTSPVVTIRERLGQRTRTTITNVAKIGLGMVLGVLLGMEIRDRQLIHHSITYVDVEVVQKVTDREFWIRPDRMRKQHIQLCPESSVGWVDGEVLSDWTFEQRSGCKRIISYHEKQKGELNAAIQMR
jgi:hypothetical protein